MGWCNYLRQCIGLNWTDDEQIVEFEEDLNDEDAKKFLPYIMMFHVLKLEYKRLKEE